MVETGILCPMIEDVRAHMIVPVRIEETRIKNAEVAQLYYCILATVLNCINYLTVELFNRIIVFYEVYNCFYAYSSNNLRICMNSLFLQPKIISLYFSNTVAANTLYVRINCKIFHSRPANIGTFFFVRFWFCSSSSSIKDLTN